MDGASRSSSAPRARRRARPRPRRVAHHRTRRPPRRARSCRGRSGAGRPPRPRTGSARSTPSSSNTTRSALAWCGSRAAGRQVPRASRRASGRSRTRPGPRSPRSPKTHRVGAQPHERDLLDRALEARRRIGAAPIRPDVRIAELNEHQRPAHSFLPHGAELKVAQRLCQLGGEEVEEPASGLRSRAPGGRSPRPRTGARPRGGARDPRRTRRPRAPHRP